MNRIRSNEIKELTKLYYNDIKYAYARFFVAKLCIKNINYIIEFIICKGDLEID